VCLLQDAALQLFLAVTVRAESAAKGASAINERVNVVDFFGSHVLPELEDVNVNARHIIRADCLKFVSTFRQHFSVEALRGLMPLLIAHMSATPVVLQTYAASCIERLLNVKEKSSLTNQWVRKLDRSALQPFLEVGRKRSGVGHVLRIHMHACATGRPFDHKISLPMNLPLA
jgi:exportin-2 (importin alpha re-exporter)